VERIPHDVFLPHLIIARTLTGHEFVEEAKGPPGDPFGADGEVVEAGGLGELLKLTLDVVDCLHA
jgi:hypothetical protein